MKTLGQIKSVLPEIIGFLFILLFVYAGLSKLIEFKDFQTQLGQSPLLGAFAIPISYGVILLELLISILLVFQKTRLLALYSSYFLMVMFTAYIIIILNFTSFTPCSCGGVLEDLGWAEHLIFNIAFVFLGVMGILLIDEKQKKKVVFSLLGLLVLGIVLVVMMFLLSEKEIQRNNAFQRKYIPHGLEELGSYQLESNSFYIAGIDDSMIYLGNYNAPLYLKAISKDLNCSNEFKVEIDDYDLPYKRVRIEVKPGYFFVGDGTVPVLFRGSTESWKAKKFSQDDAYFYDFVSQDSNQLIFTTTSSLSGFTVLGQMKKNKTTVEVELNHDIIKAQTDGSFDTDGQLIYDLKTGTIAYIYYYRNQYELANRELRSIKTGKSIDTISLAQIDVAYYEKEKAYKRGKALKVHRTAVISGYELFINTDRLGKYESEDVLWSASIIDRYNIAQNEYTHSFYFYHQPDRQLREFRVIHDTIIGLVDDQLWIQRIKPEFFR